MPRRPSPGSPGAVPSAPPDPAVSERPSPPEAPTRPLVLPSDQSPALLGLDISQDEVVACLLLPGSDSPTAIWSAPNNRPGAESLASRIVALSSEHRFQHLQIGLEATGLYWWHLACLLKGSPCLEGLSHEVYILNPNLVDGLKRAYPNKGKTDQIDALFIARRLRLGGLPAPFAVDVAYAPLQRLTRFRVHLTKTLAREKNYFLAFLFLKFSAYSQSELFGDVFGATSSALLEDFTTEELVSRPLEDLAHYLDAKGRHRFADPTELAAAIKQAARDSYRLDSVLDAPLKIVLGTTLATIRTLQRQLSEVDKTIERELMALPLERRIIDSIPGLGPVLTAGLVAEIGDIRRFKDDAGLAKLAGLVWNRHQSGGFEAEDRPLSKAGNAYLRYYLVEAANSVRLRCAEYRDYYWAKHTESPKHAHKRALVLTARKLVRLLDSLLRTGEAYRSPATRQGRKEGTSPSGISPTD